MKLDVRAVAMTAGTVAVALFTLCTVALAVAPVWSMEMTSSLFHFGMPGVARAITWSGYAVGLFCWGLGTALVFSAAAVLYNRWAAPTVG